MKKVIAVLTIVMLAVFLASSTWSIWRLSAQSSSSARAEIPNKTIMQTAQTENAQNHKLKAEENVSGSVDSGGYSCSNAQSAETKTGQSTATSDSLPEDSQFPSEPNQGTDVSSTPMFPDGAIYLGGEPPYAYIPTYDPREPNIIRIPGVPPESLGN